MKNSDDTFELNAVNDVYISIEAKLLGNIFIGGDCIIGASSVVDKPFE